MGCLTDLLWVIGKDIYYSLEGVIFIGGAAIQWLRDGIRIIKDAQECDILAEKVKDTGGVYVVPAFTGFALLTGILMQEAQSSALQEGHQGNISAGQQRNQLHISQKI